jgi:hypothetical protein
MKDAHLLLPSSANGKYDMSRQLEAAPSCAQAVSISQSSEGLTPFAPTYRSAPLVSVSRRPAAALTNRF